MLGLVPGRSLGRVLVSALVVVLALAAGACGSTAVAPGVTPPGPETSQGSPVGAFDTDGDGYITVGFAQTGSESGWRTKNSEDIKRFFVESNGFKLEFADADGDDGMQKEQVRGFIARGVEVIVLVPIDSGGWEPVLELAAAKNIPVVNADRRVDHLKDSFLFFIGSNYRQEGDNAVAWLEQYASGHNLLGQDIRIVHLTGSLGSDASVGLVGALEAGVARNGWQIVKQQSGGYAQEMGREAMTYVLGDIGPAGFNVIWSDNDDMTFGAVDALLAKGLDPANYIIISFDGNKRAVQMVIDGVIDAIAERSPLFAAQLGEAILAGSKGAPVDKVIDVKEGIIDQTNATQKLDDAFVA